jgi:hypothetical protein
MPHTYDTRDNYFIKYYGGGTVVSRVISTHSFSELPECVSLFGVICRLPHRVN